jgi:hypothetical protein
LVFKLPLMFRTLSRRRTLRTVARLVVGARWHSNARFATIEKLRHLSPSITRRSTTRNTSLDA